jgi:ABC-type methionine transport system ATPase subunit
MLSIVNLDGFADRQTNTLSGGQKQRVAIAGALAQCPRVRAAGYFCYVLSCA